MGRRQHTPEQIITALREAEVGLANGKAAVMVSRELGISEQMYYRWRKMDKLILEEASKGNF